MKTAKVGLYGKMLQYRGSVYYNAWIIVSEFEEDVFEMLQLKIFIPDFLIIQMCRKISKKVAA